MADTANRRVLLGLVGPAMLMPMLSTMSRVALPIVRGDFALRADMAAWVDVGFTLPFMLLMPVYGRLGDGLGARRLLRAGIALFVAGTAVVLAAADLAGLLLGRALQGLGLAGVMPLSMVLIAAHFPAQRRGRTLGSWSTIGPATGFLAPLLAGVLVAAWGWRGAFAPPLLCGLLALLAVHRLVPARAQEGEATGYLRAFDWGGVGLLAAGLSCLVFFLSSRAITGAPPLRDLRLAWLSLGFLLAFFWWERRRHLPFMSLSLFANGAFVRGSFCAAMRMFAMAGIGFLIPLYLVDIQQVTPAELGGMLMIGAGAMTLVVRVAGALADRWSNRWLVLAGLLVQMAVMLGLWRLPATASLWAVGALQAAHGLGAGAMLATLHKVVLGSVERAETGAAAGLYSMFRFLGAALGTALSGVLLQAYLDAQWPAIAAYQHVFLVFALFPALGALVALSLRE